MKIHGLIEQYYQIGKNAPVYAGDLISKVATVELLQMKLVARNRHDDYILSDFGGELFRRIVEKEGK